MRLFLSDPEEILVEFADAAAKVRKVWVPNPADGFIFPQAGKSGLSTPRNRDPDERRAERSASTIRYEQRRRAGDQEYARRQQDRNNERTRAWRQRQRAKRIGETPTCDHCGRVFESRRALGQHRGWTTKRTRSHA